MPLNNLSFKILISNQILFSISFQPQHDKPKNMTCAPSENSDQTGHPPSLIRVFAVRILFYFIQSQCLSSRCGTTIQLSTRVAIHER